MRTLYWIIVCLSLWSATPAQGKKDPEKDRYGYYLAQNRTYTRIPFELHSNLIIVPVQVNNSDTLYFILDTGVSSTIITDPAALKKQSLKFARRVTLTGAGEGEKLMASVAIDNHLKMGSLHGAHQNIVVLDSDILRLSEYVGVPVHGIFGYDIFSNFVVTIDFQLREIVLTQPKRFKYRKSKGDKYPITIENTKPYLDVMALLDDEKSLPLRVVLDTGAGHALLVDRSTNTTTMPLPDKVIRAQLGRGLNGVINGSLGRIRGLRLGRFELDNVLTSFPDSAAFGMKLAKGPERQGNIGCELLRRFRVTFNYPEKYIVLKPVRRMMRQSFEHDMSGIELRARGEKFRNYYVDKIVAGSPADLAGLKEGDELLFVNNSPVGTITISDIYKLLQKGEGKEISLVLRRGNELVVGHVVLKRLI